MDSPVRLHWLDPRNPHQPFPPAHLAMREPNGLLAIGGDLSVTRLLRAYAQGIFPWYNPDEPILWWCPDPRAVLIPADLHVSRSLRRTLRRADYAVTMDRDFDGVLAACAAPRGNSRGTWLGDDMRHAYRQLYERGHAHSVEVWRAGVLVGGLYGVALGRIFFGESMFSRIDDGSKIALYWLCRQLENWAFDLIDCQVSSAHLRSLGAIELPRSDFLRRLALAQDGGRLPSRWHFEIERPADPAHLPP
ncbi:leucyl/phenylalanyl-tRNA--protein transferase [Fontimonas thermophila]|uniref:Leucyl/phenylalanyl-tRNA--protein transferase n=1 Tax=Fontimonas thermophila TaxID=1076937 RepID=A0A1I2IFD7_9GAMM|nr:leucyl/phenylalanyl-tRNA--protein transferase [Fontimonas thermophila]SFF40358.1 leucyl/phenylalanyl-tRNA--protein transferase [Fontimonas thermophila]